MNDESDDEQPKGWFTPGRFALILAVLVFIPFWDVATGINSFVVRDFGLFSYPMASFHREHFWRGEMPLWNPLSFCGIPFLAQFNTLTLYPLSLIYLFLPLMWSVSLFCVAHLYLAGLGMYFLASRWTGSRNGGALAGVAFAFSGLSLNFMMWSSHIATYAWMPWVVLAVEEAWRGGGRRIILAALAGAMEMLAGGPEEILVTWLLLFVLALVECRKRSVLPLILIRRFVSTGALVLGLTAMQILPFLDLALHSSRNTSFGDSDWSMPPYGWASFLVPMFQTTVWQKIVVQSFQYWTSSYYAGVGIVFLAVIALLRQRSWRVGLLGFLMILSLVLALGNQGWMFPWLKKAFPVLGLFRYPVKFVIITLFAAPLLAAFGISHYEQWKPQSVKDWKLEFFCGGILLVLIGYIVWFAWRFPLYDSPWLPTAKNGLGRAGFFLLLMAALYLFVTRTARRDWAMLALVTVCWLDLLTHVPWQNPTLDPAVYQPGIGAMAANFNPRPVPGQSRVMMSPFSARQLYNRAANDPKVNILIDRATFLANCNLLDDIPKVDGFVSLNLDHIDKVMSLFERASGEQINAMENFMGVSQTIATGKVFDWVPRTNYLPIISAGEAPEFAPDKTALSAFTNSSIDPHKVVFLPLETKGVVKAKYQPAARAVARKFADTEVVIDVDAPGDAMVVILQSYYHNWKAYVDGAPVPLWQGNYVFQAVEAPSGRHEVRLVYEDRAFWWGSVITGISLALCCAVWVKNKRINTLPHESQC